MRSIITRVRQQRHEQRMRTRFRLIFQRGVWGIVIFGAIGCQDLANPTLPAGTQSPDTYLSRKGGLMLAIAAERQFKDMWVQIAVQSGLLTDELTNRVRHTVNEISDHRNLSENEFIGGKDLYVGLHKLRGQARLARAVLVAYAPDLSPAVRGRLFAFEAYAELWLADMYCSGVPLSTIDYQGDYTNLPPSTTDEIYSHAAVLFDSALALAADSMAVQTLAHVGKGRVLLALARYEDAEAAVATVQGNDAYRTLIAFGWRNRSTSDFTNAFGLAGATVSDNEGINGLDFRSSGDPRTAAHLVEFTEGAYRGSAFFPSKYPLNDSSLVAIAGGLDAQLINAEAALQRNSLGEWLSTLNTLRTTGTYTRIDTVYTDTTKTTIRSVDTVWQAGTGGVAGLRPLTDPGTKEERVKLHFAERAAWLFVSGQRQGDLRRLVRKYGLVSDDIYPTGAYSGVIDVGLYGNNIDLPIPDQERQNPLFKGCLHRD